MPRLVRVRLAAMMFLFFFSLGSWAVTLSTYLMSAPTKGGLNFTTAEVGWIYSTFAFGGMIAPLLVGLLADRLFSAERVMGVSGIVCAALLFAAGSWCDDNYPRAKEVYQATAAKYGPLAELDPPTLDKVNDDPAVRKVARRTFWPLFVIMFAYCISLQIALTLSTVLTFRTLHTRGHRFGHIRLFGTVGWIVTGNAVGMWLEPVSAEPLYLAAVSCLIFGVYAFTLPRTPPKNQSRSIGEMLGLPALRLFRDPSFGIFVGIALLVSTMNQFYGVYAHRYLTDLKVWKPEQVMTIGQAVEVVCMLVIPWLGPRKHLKLLMIVGLAGWVLRGIAMTWGSVPVVLALGVPMHGWSYAFFFIVAASYLDREAPPTLRASAQGIITFVSSGIGVWIGNLLAGFVVDSNRTGTIIDWQPVWAVPLVGCVVALVVFVVFFKPPPDQPTEPQH